MSSISSGFKKPEEEGTLVFDGQETRPVGFVQEDGVSGFSDFSSDLRVGHGANEADAEADDKS